MPGWVWLFVYMNAVYAIRLGTECGNGNGYGYGYGYG